MYLSAGAANNEFSSLMRASDPSGDMFIRGEGVELMTSFIKPNSVDKELQYENTLPTLNNMNSKQQQNGGGSGQGSCCNVPIEHDE